MRMFEFYRVDEYYLEVRASNEAAVRLYEKLGFRSVRVLRGYYLDGEDAFLMARPAPYRVEVEASAGGGEGC